LDRQIVDGREPTLHETRGIELPILIAIGAKPLAAVVMAFIGEANRDTVALERPQLLYQAVVQFPVLFPCEEWNDLGPAARKLGAIAPTAVLRIDKRHPLRITAIPAVFGHPNLGDRGFAS